MKHAILSIAVASAAVCTLGCKKDAMVRYRVAKAARVSAGPVRGLKWTLPAGWRELPPSGMRAATFVSGEGERRVEVSVVAVSGDGGGLLAVMDRWRGLAGLGPLSEAALRKELRTVRCPAGEAVLADFRGKGRRLLGAVLPQGGRSWCFKAVAGDAALERAKPAFLELLRSLRT